MVVAMVPGPAIMGMARGKTLTSSRVRASSDSVFVSRAPDGRPKSISTETRKSSAPPNVEGVETDAQAVEQEAANQGEEEDNGGADENCSRDDIAALSIIEVRGERDNDRDQPYRIDNGKESDECANSKYHSIKPSDVFFHYILSEGWRVN